MTSESDEHLIRYLLGEIPDAEADRLDERSITDPAFALRLRGLEDDLVDRYARGEPADASLGRFGSMYRLSAHLRGKARFAEALQTPAGALHTPASRLESGSSTGGGRPAPARYAWWPLAAAAVVTLAAVGYLGTQNLRLREGLGQLDTRRAAVERENEQLQQDLERARATPAPPRTPVTATFLLPPPRRGLGNDGTLIAIPRGSDQLALRLGVESDSHSAFWGALRDPATGRIVWRSADLQAEASGSDRFVTLTVPVAPLAAQRYLIELTGFADRAPELVGHYPIRVVVE